MMGNDGMNLHLMTFKKVQNRLSEKKKKTGDRIKSIKGIFIYICVFIARNAFKKKVWRISISIYLYVYI